MGEDERPSPNKARVAACRVSLLNTNNNFLPVSQISRALEKGRHPGDWQLGRATETRTYVKAVISTKNVDLCDVPPWCAKAMHIF